MHPFSHPRNWRGRLALLALAAAAAAAEAAPADPAAPAGVAPAASAGVAASAPISASAQASAAPIAYTQRLLDNGMRVLAVPRRGSGRVAVQVWYQVGGKDDPQGRSGFAHLFEHLMFKATRHLKAEAFDRMTEDVGGHNNAFTAEDVTAYVNVVPANHLERLLWAEAERLSNLQVDEANFHSERAVVQEEFRQRVLAAPYGLLFNELSPMVWQVHPYSRPVIGSLADLDAATLDDVRAFHRTYYRPDNATLIVAGDFDAKQLDAWVDRYFAPLAKPAQPIPRVTAVEPPLTQSRAQALTGANVPAPAAVLLWRAPPARHADAPALAVAQALLAGGESSRLHQALVYRDQVALQAGVEANLLEQDGYFAVYAIAAGKSQPAGLATALQRELSRLAAQPPSAAEMDKARTQLVTAALKSRESAEGMADALGWAVIRYGDAAAANRELAALQAVTAADVQRVLRTWVVGRPHVTLSYTQAPPAAAAAPASQPASDAQKGQP